MRGLTLTQPAAYLAGVVVGDGWCTRQLGLRVADEEFALAFSVAVRTLAPGVLARVIFYRGYWDVRASNKTGCWSYLLDLELPTADEKRAWLLGLFDSEGNASLRDLPTVSPAARGRRVAMFSTNQETLARAGGYLTALEIAWRACEWTRSKGHLGRKPVYAVEVRGGRENYARFAELVGSNIERKQRVLEALPLSYQPPGHHRRMQARGVETRRARKAAGGRY